MSQKVFISGQERKVFTDLDWGEVFGPRSWNSPFSFITSYAYKLYEHSKTNFGESLAAMSLQNEHRMRVFYVMNKGLLVWI